MVVFVWAHKVIVSDPKGQIIVGTINTVESVCRTIGSLLGPVQAFNHLLVWPEFFGYLVIISETDDLCDIELKLFTIFAEELLCSQRVGTVSIGYETEMLRQLLEMSKSHSHGKDTWADTSIIRDLVSDDRSFGGIHDEPYIGFDTANLDVSFICCKDTAGMVIIVVYEWFYT